MKVYVVGTIMTNRLSLDENIKERRQTRPQDIPRGSFTFSRSVAVPALVFYHWWDRKPVHYLCTGATMTESTIQRNVKQRGPITVPCPAALNDSQCWMGGVDVHDQLRLQKFSLQTSPKFKKYYKNLFVGFVDMARQCLHYTHRGCQDLQVGGDEACRLVRGATESASSAQDRRLCRRRRHATGEQA